MAGGRLRLLGSQAARFAKRSISYYKAKSGLLVPEGYEKTSKFDDIKGFLTKNWYKIDESARGAIIQTTTKYVLTASGGGSLILLNMGWERLNDLEDKIDEAKRERQEIKDMIKAESKKTEEKLQKIIGQLWLFRIMPKNFDPKVLSGVILPDLHDPVNILKGIHDPQESPLTKDQERINKMKLVFSLHDMNKDELMMKKIEADEKRGLDFAQFLTLTELKKDADREEQLRAAFQSIDKNNDGYISGVELRPMLVTLGDKLSEDQIVKMIQLVEKNGGRVTYDDLKQMILG